MKTQNVSAKKGSLMFLPVLALLLSQCVSCPPLSRGENSSLTGCWLTEFSQPRRTDDPIREDIIYREIPVEITVNADNSINGKWWSFPVETGREPNTGLLKGNIEGLKLIGEHFPNGTLMGGMAFRLSPSGLTFNGDYEGKLVYGTERRFFWNGVKVGNCKCSETLTRNPGAYVAGKSKR